MHIYMTWCVCARLSLGASGGSMGRIRVIYWFRINTLLDLAAT